MKVHLFHRNGGLRGVHHIDGVGHVDFTQFLHWTRGDATYLTDDLYTSDTCLIKALVEQHDYIIWDVVDDVDDVENEFALYTHNGDICKWMRTYMDRGYKLLTCGNGRILFSKPRKGGV